jgi:putative serine protease PepD
MATLIFEHGEIGPVTRELVGDLITIGRDPSNAVVIDDPTVSGQHASLMRSPTGYRLTELNSTNGTQINGISITDAELKDGDEIRFGSVTAVFRVGEGAKSVSGEPKTLATSRISRKKVLITMGVLALVAISIAIWTATVLYQKNRLVTTTQRFDLVTLARKTRNAVVLIEVFDTGKKEIATGSGFFISSDGLLVTNYHVIKNASSALAKTEGGDLLPIKGAVAVDRENDLALLTIEGRKLPFLPLGNSEDVEAGDHIAVIGSPLGLEGSLSEGIVSAKRDESPGQRPLLQITAPLSSGSSGSPVLDATGKVIGVATMVLRDGQSLNFAVPVEAALAMLHSQEQQHAATPLQQLAFQDTLNDAQNELAVSDSPEYQAAFSAMSDALFAAGSNEFREKLQGDAIASPAAAAQVAQALAENPRRDVDWKKALDATKALVAKYPRSAIAYEQLGRVHEMMGFADQAVEAYQRAVELNPDSPSVWESLGRIYKEKEKFTQADFAFSQAIAYQTKRVQRRPPGSYDFALQNLGNMYREAGNIDAAKQTYLRDIQENPKGAIMSLHGLMDIYVSEGNEKAAFETAYQIVLLSPKHRNPEAEAWDFLASWYYNHNREADGYRCSINAERLGFRR